MSVKLPGTTVTLELVRVPAGTVTIADPRKKGAPAKVPVKAFWMARTELTWEAYDPFVYGLAPSGQAATPHQVDAMARPSKPYIPPDLGWGHNGFPVINVTHHAATQYCAWLSALTGRKFRLATEAEWEWACRGGGAAAFAPKGAALDAVAWHSGNSGGQTRAVGGKKANAFGLVDMLGNAGEWANDLAGKPVLCGGSYADAPESVHSAAREYQSPDWNATDPQMPKSKWWLSDGSFVGFRVVCE
ncbi:MAG: formylglycine-generating enzyme family protein [Chthonomonadales bacterium]|nr:formylglycine-generating enzyme family protein [Chthonomonadales bacterium]